MLWNRLHLEVDLDMCVRSLSLWFLQCQDLLDLQVLIAPEAAVAVHCSVDCLAQRGKHNVLNSKIMSVFSLQLTS